MTSPITLCSLLVILVVQIIWIKSIIEVKERLSLKSHHNCLDAQSRESLRVPLQGLLFIRGRWPAQIPEERPVPLEDYHFVVHSAHEGSLLYGNTPEVCSGASATQET